MKNPIEVGPDLHCTCESCQQSRLIVRLTDQMVADKKTIDALKEDILALQARVARL